MNRNKRLLGWGLGIGIALIVGACQSSSSSGGNSTSSTATSAPIMIASVTGHQSADGSWERCTPTGSPGSSDQREVMTFSGSSMTLTDTTYASTNLSCTGTPTTSSNSFSGSSPGDKTVHWSDGVKVNATPPSGLSPNPTATMVTNGASLKTIYFLDDRATPWVLWPDEKCGACTVDSSGYPDFLFNDPVYRYIKQ